MLHVYIDLVYYIFRVFLSGAKYSGLIENYDLSKTSTAYMCQPIIGLGKYVQQNDVLYIMVAIRNVVYDGHLRINHSERLIVNSFYNQMFAKSFLHCFDKILQP